MRSLIMLSFISSAFLTIEAHAQMPADSLVKTWLVPDPFHGSNPFKKDTAVRFLKFTGATVQYMYDYRSLVDTPFAEVDLGQHQLQSQFSLLVLNKVPLNGYAYARKTNSKLFRDIYEFQIQFDVQMYRELQRAALVRQLQKKAELLLDSTSQRLYLLKEGELQKMAALKNWFTEQKLIEANEVIKIPESSFDYRLTDSANLARYDSLRSEALRYIEAYQKFYQGYAKLRFQRDSIKGVVERSLQKMRALRQLMDGGHLNNSSFARQLEDSIASITGKDTRYDWLSRIRSLSVGRSTLNTSELTAKNVSITGLNFEYSSWYYFSVAAGGVDYRFKDFLSYQTRVPQYLLLFRLGLGKPEDDYIIVSYFQGRKQTFNLRDGRAAHFSGVSLQGKWQLTRNGFLVTEAAQSFPVTVPDTTGKKAWSLRNRANKAFSTRLYLFNPGTRSRLEMRYSYSGADYRAFNSLQASTEQTAWSVKYNQPLFNRAVRLDLSVSKNDFQSPYLMHLQTNMVYKTLTATLQLPRFPVLSLGYLPMSQTMVAGNLVQESRFQTIQGSATHFYKLGEARASTLLFFTRFFKDGADTGFIYYDAVNVFATQNFFFPKLVVNVGISKTKNAGYSYTVFDESVSVPVYKRLNLDIGLKINQFNRRSLKTGGYLGGQWTVFKRDVVSFRAEQGFLPSNKGRLVSNVCGTVQFSKQIL